MNDENTEENLSEAEEKSLPHQAQGEDQGINCVCPSDECSGKLPKPPDRPCDDLTCPECGETMIEE